MRDIAECWQPAPAGQPSPGCPVVPCCCFSLTMEHRPGLNGPSRLQQLHPVHDGYYVHATSTSHTCFSFDQFCLELQPYVFYQCLCPLDLSKLAVEAQGHWLTDSSTLTTYYWFLQIQPGLTGWLLLWPSALLSELLLLLADVPTCP
jgi:hypothetical protein